MLIDRRDKVINIGEMKFAVNEYEIDKDYEKKLINKIECFRKETGPKKALHLYYGNNLRRKAKLTFRQNPK